ncbi:Defensin [Medicago truncatula]|uniref:Defensin n=1 Tax=Medicago truncatula TaxID=3880 RepID=A0A072UW22_MEDTR|nr:Defensin [Medicago truncatula]
MNTTRSYVVTMVLLFAFFICASETCLALERRELFGIKCNNDAYCQSVSDCDIHKGEQSHCIDGKCWCFLPPSSANKHT